MLSGIISGIFLLSGYLEQKCSVLNYGSVRAWILFSPSKYGPLRMDQMCVSRIILLSVFDSDMPSYYAQVFIWLLV